MGRMAPGWDNLSQAIGELATNPSPMKCEQKYSQDVPAVQPQTMVPV